MSWSLELWDSYNSVVGHVCKEANDLVEVYAKYFKEKAELEKDYSKGLRKLIAKYEPKKLKENEEKTEMSSFRNILVETGYQAGQHELLAEHVTKVIVKEIHHKSSEFHKKIKENSKQARIEQEKMDSSYLKLEKAKLKYQKSFHDWKESDRTYQKADKDGKISRNEVLRMKDVSESKEAQYQASSLSYRKQMDKTNNEQREYFDCLLPGVLISLQEVDNERGEYVRRLLEMCMVREREMVEMVNKCREGMDEAIASIDVEKDQDIVVERYKTGEFPPTNIQFEEMQFGRGKKSGSLARRMSSSNFSKKREKQNLFQKKRKLLKNIDKLRSEIDKGTKEKHALQLMVQTYTKTPDFGDASKFQEELDLVSRKVEKHEEDLIILNRELDLVESKMNLNMRHSLLASPSRSLISMNTTSSSYESDCTGYGEDTGVFENNDVDTHSLDSLQKISNDDTFDTYANKCVSSDRLDSEASNRLSDEWEEDFEVDNSDLAATTVTALYSYDGVEEGTLSMELGDQFEVLEADVDGWIYVRRKGFIEEGFIPTSFTEPL